MDDKKLNAMAHYIFADMQTMRTEAVFRVVISWANKGRSGEDDRVVVADDAIEAIQLAWSPEDPRDIRNVSCEWLSPIDCVVTKRADDPQPESEADDA